MILMVAVFSYLAQVDASEQHVAWQVIGVALQQVCHLAEGHCVVSCQMMSFSEQQVCLYHARAVLQ